MAYQKQTWNNNPSGGTPITAERLNHIEEGIANPVETDSVARVTNVVSRNLFDKKLITSTSNTVKYIPITVEKNTNYTLSTNSGTETQAHVFLTTSPSGASSTNNGAIINKPRTANSGDRTILYIGYNSDLTNYWIQLEKGSVANPYTPYLNMQELEKNSIINNYSTGEQVIGKWIDGKPLYRKTLSFTAPNSGGENHAYNIENVDIIWVDSGSSYFQANNSYGATYPITDYDWHVYVNKTNVRAEADSDRSYGTMVVTILYTKTTD